MVSMALLKAASTFLPRCKNPSFFDATAVKSPMLSEICSAKVSEAEPVWKSFLEKMQRTAKSGLRKIKKENKEQKEEPEQPEQNETPAQEA